MESSSSPCVKYAVYGATVLVVLYYAFRTYAKYKLSYWSKRGVNSPPTHPIFGNFTDSLKLQKAPSQVMEEIYKSGNEDDPYIGFYIFHKPILLLRDPKVIKQIMVKDFDIFPNRRFGSANEKDSVGLVNLLGIKQPRWKYLRSKMSPALTGQKLKTMVPLMLDRWQPMFDYIDSTPKDGAGWMKFELKNLSSRYVTDIISSLAFGITTNSFDINDIAFWEAGQKVLTGFKRGIVLLILFFIPELGKLLEPFITGPAEFFRQVFWHSMNTREKSGAKRGDLIDSLLALKKGDQNPDFKFEGDNLLAQAVAFYVAGFEASSTAIAFTLFELARHPEHQSRLYAEIGTVISKGDLSMESVMNLPFLDRVVSETLRMYPPLPVSDRIALRDYKIPGTDLTIEKGTPVYVSINATNHDPRHYRDPDTFIPLRRKEEDSEIQDSLAFGVGPRSCVGQRMGQLITKVAVIAIISNYALSYRSDTDSILNPVSVFTNAADGLNVSLKNRKERCP